MQIRETPIAGLKIIEPTVFRDSRGYFFENFRSSYFSDMDLDVSFVQENESKSNKGVLRGLHLQSPPYGQTKLIRVVSGAILDVAVDMRKASPSFGQHFSLELNEENKISFFVPEGFAHGFYCLEDNTIVQYKCSSYYHKASEVGILWSDPHINVIWPSGDRIVSEKDEILPNFKSFNSPY
jgi:dTDP-4-dehydrorhamnose 3,5-epimerase